MKLERTGEILVCYGWRDYELTRAVIFKSNALITLRIVANSGLPSAFRALRRLLHEGQRVEMATVLITTLCMIMSFAQPFVRDKIPSQMKAMKHGDNS